MAPQKKQRRDTRIKLNMSFEEALAMLVGAPREGQEPGQPGGDSREDAPQVPPTQQQEDDTP